MTRRALERLLRTPGVTLFQVAAIAVAIAATAVVYSAIQGLFVPSAAERLERVVNLYKAPFPTWQGNQVFSPEEVEHLRAAQTSFEHVTAWTRVRAELGVDRIAREALCEAVTANYFHALDVELSEVAIVAVAGLAGGGTGGRFPASNRRAPLPSDQSEVETRCFGVARRSGSFARLAWRSIDASEATAMLFRHGALFLRLASECTRALKVLLTN